MLGHPRYRMMAGDQGADNGTAILLPASSSRWVSRTTRRHSTSVAVVLRSRSITVKCSQPRQSLQLLTASPSSGTGTLHLASLAVTLMHIWNCEMLLPQLPGVRGGAQKEACSKGHPCPFPALNAPTCTGDCSQSCWTLPCFAGVRARGRVRSLHVMLSRPGLQDA